MSIAELLPCTPSSTPQNTAADELASWRGLPSLTLARKVINDPRPQAWLNHMIELLASPALAATTGHLAWQEYHRWLETAQLLDQGLIDWRDINPDLTSPDRDADAAEICAENLAEAIDTLRTGT